MREGFSLLVSCLLPVSLHLFFDRLDQGPAGSGGVHHSGGVQIEKKDLKKKKEGHILTKIFENDSQQSANYDFSYRSF